MLKYLTLENILSVAGIVFWAMFYGWTAVSVVATLYATAERLILTARSSGEAVAAGHTSNWIPQYPRAALTRGALLGAAGIAGVVVGWLIMPLSAGIAPFPAPSRVFAGAVGIEQAGLIVAMLSAIAFNFGVWLALTGEEWAKG